MLLSWACLYRLSGIIHVLYAAIGSYLPEESRQRSQDDLEKSPSPLSPQHSPLLSDATSGSTKDLLEESGCDINKEDDCHGIDDDLEKSPSPLPPQHSPLLSDAANKHISYTISEEEAQMAMLLTEYFQDQRKIYEIHVSTRT